MEYVEIDKIINVELGKTPSRNNSDYWNGKHTWIAISDMNKKYIVNSKEKITNEAIENTKIKKVPKDTVIMSFKLSIGKRAITKSEVYTNEAIAAFHIKDLKYLIPEYLYYALESVDFLKYTDKAVKGKTLNKEKLKKIKIPIFPLTEQLKISEILNKTQKIIEDKKKQIFLFDELIKSRFIEMFGDPIKNNKGWEQKFLEKISSFESKNITKYLKCNNLIWLLNLEDIERNTGKIIKKKMITKFEIPTSIIAFDENYVLYSKLRPYLNKVALPLEEGIGTSELIPIRPRDEVNRIYLFNVLTSESVLKFLKTKVSGAKMPRIIMSDFKKLKISLPGIKLQNEFAEFVTKIDKLKFEAEKSLKEMENLYDSLMQKFFKQ